MNEIQEQDQDDGYIYLPESTLGELIDALTGLAEKHGRDTRVFSTADWTFVGSVGFSDVLYSHGAAIEIAS